MFTIALVFVAIAIVTRLVTVVRHDRSRTTPRSHAHELDPYLGRDNSGPLTRAMPDGPAVLCLTHSPQPHRETT